MSTPILNTSLLREKFLLRDLSGAHAAAPLIATGNRIVVPLLYADGRPAEKFVVRAQTMYTALRVAAFIVRAFHETGPLSPRAFDWAGHWASVESDYERKFNQVHWGVVYKDGHPVFEHGTRHPFLDVIEQCDVRNAGEYDDAIPMTEAFFEKAGRPVRIDHDGTIGVVISVNDTQQRCGLVFRNPNRKGTFNFTIKNIPDDGHPHYHLCLNHAAALLESVQLSVSIGFKEAKVNTGVAFDSEATAITLNQMKRQLGRVNAEIGAMEQRYTVTYRPERPDAFALMVESEEYARLEPLREG